MRWSSPDGIYMVKENGVWQKLAITMRVCARGGVPTQISGFRKQLLEVAEVWKTKKSDTGRKGVKYPRQREQHVQKL